MTGFTPQGRQLVIFTLPDWRCWRWSVAPWWLQLEWLQGPVPIPVLPPSLHAVSGLGLSHTKLFWHSEMVKPYHGNRMRKLVHAKRQGNFTVKAKEGIRPCRWDYKDTEGAFCYLTAVGQTQWSPKAWPSSEGNISEGLPGQKGEMGPARGIGSTAALLVGQSPSLRVVPEGA